MRSYNEPIEVRRGLVSGCEAPAQFLWRNRLWVIKDVQTRWMETTPWWDGCGVQVLRGDADRNGADEGLTDENPAGENPAGGNPAGRSPADNDLLAEEEIWRVVATKGRQGSDGVYELSHAQSTGEWRLRAVMD